MKRWTAWLAAAAAGSALTAVVLRPLGIAQPNGLAITRAQARRIADAEAARLGVDVASTWPVTVWEQSEILEKELAPRPDVRRRAESDPVVGPRLGGFHVVYFRLGLEKWPESAYVLVGKRGEVLAARVKARPEETARDASAEELRRRADEFVASRAIPGAPSPVFDSARPTVLQTRTDTTFRYRVPSDFPAGRVGFYLHVSFIGERFAGFEQIEEYKDASRFRYDSGAGIAAFFVELATIYLLLFVLLVRFLRKYHAGEVGVAGGGVLLAALAVTALVENLQITAGSALTVGMGGVDARLTALADAGFKILFFDLPLALLVFVAWSVGESDARERWSERLASYDALLSRRLRNATVGRACLIGLMAGPAVAAVALGLSAAAVSLGVARAALGGCTEMILFSLGGPSAMVPLALVYAIAVPIVAVLAPLAPLARRRLLPVGLLLTAFIGAALGAMRTPVEPVSVRLALCAGGVLAAAAVFLFHDLLAAAVAVFSGTLLVALLPYAAAVSGPARMQAIAALVLPHAAVLAFAAMGLASGREVAYRHEDMAPHVKRIVERERVKAEIDAANRIQAALLPSGDPQVEGTSVASHYRAATEIGGDYFDFLLFPDGSLGLAFGDVSGHGLTSGIVMAMAKSALLVQIGYESSPARVLEVLNQTVMKTAPRRILMTFFFGILDPDTGELRFASAGHLDPYVYRAAERRLEPLSAWGFPLGVKRREPFRESVVVLAPDDRVILYSDGLIEAVDDDGEPYGFERFESVLKEHGGGSAHEIKSALLGSIKRFTRNRPPEDDQTLVVLSYEGRVSAAA